MNLGIFACGLLLKFRYCSMFSFVSFFACGSDPYDSMDFLGVLMCGFDVVSSRGFEILIYLTGLRFGCFRGFY